MGNSNVITFEEHQDISNQIMQSSQQFCTITASNDISGSTFIVIGGTGDVSFIQKASVSGASCNMAQVLDTQIQNIIESMLKQTAQSSSGFSLDFSSNVEQASIYQTIRNSVTQLMSSTCTISSVNTFNNNYVFVKDRKGAVLFSQDANVTQGTCNMSSIAREVVYNQQKADTDQAEKTVSIFSYFFIALIVCIVAGAIVVGIYLLSGGLNKTLQAVQAGNGGGIDPSVLNSVLGSSGGSAAGGLGGLSKLAAFA